MRPRPTTLAEAVRLYRQYGEGQEGVFAVLLDEFLDAFYTETEPARRQAMIDEEPTRTGEERHDAYIGAVGEHLARRWGLCIPPWSGAPWREVTEPWFVGMMGKGLSGLLLVESPIAFRRRRIFTEAEPLRRARMPVEWSLPIVIPRSAATKQAPARRAGDCFVAALLAMTVRVSNVWRCYKSLTSRSAS